MKFHHFRHILLATGKRLSPHSRRGLHREHRGIVFVQRYLQSARRKLPADATPGSSSVSRGGGRASLCGADHGYRHRCFSLQDEGARLAQKTQGGRRHLTTGSWPPRGSGVAHPGINSSMLPGCICVIPEQAPGTFHVMPSESLEQDRRCLDGPGTGA